MRFGRYTTRCFATAFLTVIAGGCHEYVPVRAGTALPPSTTVRATLTDVGTVSVAPSFGPRVTLVEGSLVLQSDSGVVMRVAQVTRADGTEQTINGDQIVLSRSSVQDIGYVRTAVGRSVLLAGVLVGGAVAAAASLGHNGSSVGGGRVGVPGTGQ